MNFRTTVVLFIIMIAVGLLVLLTKDSGQPASTQAPTAQKLLTLTPADITKISIAPADGKRVVLDRSGGTWQMLEPVKAPAEEITVGNLVSAIIGLETRGKITADAETGFDHPPYQLELTTKDNKTIKLDVGKQSGTGGNMYVRLDGASQADVVPASLYEQISKEPKTWRNPRLFTATAMDIKQVHIATTQQSFTLEKHGADWKMTAPTEMPADSTAVSDITMALANLRAVDFTSESSDNPGNYGLDQPVATASFSTDPPATQPSASQPAMTTVKFGRFDDILKKNIFASSSSSPGVVTIAASSIDAFKKPLAELRDKRVLDVDPEKVTKISITTVKPATTQPTTQEASTSTVVLERTKVVTGIATPATGPSTMPTTAQASTQPARAKWNIASNNGIDADETKVDQLLSNLHPLRADKYLESPSEMTNPTVYTLTIETTDATHMIKVSEQGTTQPPVGEYNGMTFTLNTFFARDLEGDFVKAATPTVPSSPIPFLPSGAP